MNGLLLSPAPFLRERKVWLENVLLLAGLAPLWGIRLFADWPAELTRMGLCAGGALAALALSPGSFVRELKGLYWLVSAALCALWLPTPPVPSFAAGLFCGLLESSPRLMRWPGPKALWGGLFGLGLTFFLGSGYAWPAWSWPQLAALTPLLAYRLLTRFWTPGEFCLMAAPVFAFVLVFNKPLAFLGLWLLALSFWWRPAARSFAFVWRWAAVFVYLFFMIGNTAWLPPLGLGLIFFSGRWGQKIAEARQVETIAAAEMPPRNETRAAFIRCAHRGQARMNARFSGLPSCRLAAEAEGLYRCPQACLALGDCARLCPAGAIGPDEHGVLAVSEARCRGCGLCVEMCPKGLIAMKPRGFGAAVACGAHFPMAELDEACGAGCLGCGRCRKVCPAGAITRPALGGAVTVDKNICREYGPGCGRACIQACPRGIIGPAE